MEFADDISCIGQILEGNINAYSYLVDKHKDRVFNLAFRICGNHEEAEEIAQDAFLKAFRALKSFRRKSRFNTWLYRITYNTAISLVRARKRHELSIEDLPVEFIEFNPDNTGINESEYEYRSSLVKFAMKKLTEEERGLISLYYYEELNTEEISEITGISKNNIKVKLFRARQRLAGIIRSIEKKNLVCHE